MLLHGLPTMGSHYTAALSNDPEFADHLVRQGDLAQRKWRPPPAEWTLQHELLAGFFDRLGDWMAEYANSLRRKGQPAVKSPPRFPRPETEMDRARSRAEALIEKGLDQLIAVAHANYAAEHGGREGSTDVR